MSTEDPPTETITVTVLVAGPPDDDGVPTRTATERPWEGCVVRPGRSAATFGVEHRVTARLRVSGPLAEWITPTCRARRDGVEYWIDGAPRHLRGEQSRTELTLVTWTGA